jgi:lipopolysaccharide biosynthesis glycosyltransferase
MNNRAIIFVTDRGYIVPTLVAASQVASEVGISEVADILIYLVGMTAEELDTLSREFQFAKMTFIPINFTETILSDRISFAPSHVSKTTLARFFTAEFIPSRYEHVIYLDGDVQITGSISSLIHHSVDPGKILAANDQFFLSSAHFGSAGRTRRTHKKYMNNLGVTDPADYFNAGVLAARRETWASICHEALEFFLNNSEKCLFHDQSALNAVCLSKREIMSPLYNFSTAYAELAGSKVAPAIVHFTGEIKPWFSLDRGPWFGKFAAPYADIIRRFPFLQAYTGRWSEARARAAAIEARRQKLIGRLYSMWDLQVRRKRLFAYLKDTHFAFNSANSVG